MATANQFIKPLTTKVNANGNLEVGGCDLLNLADKYGTPLYVLDEFTLRSICRSYANAFSKYPKAQMMYASKALCSLATTAIIATTIRPIHNVSFSEAFPLRITGL